MGHIYNITIVFLFLVTIGTPPLITLFTSDREISVIEKRKLAPLPGFDSPPRDFPRKFEEYYKDHFGLKDSMVLFRNLFYFKLFKESSIPVVTVGKDGWLFYNGDAALHRFMGWSPPSSVYLESYRRILMDREEWLADMGGRYLFVPVPNKMTLFSEFLPDRIQKREGISLYDQIISYLIEHPGFNAYVDLKELFLRRKYDTSLYFKTDSHWTPKGAFVAYQAIIAKVQMLSLPENKLKAEGHSWKEVQHSGDLVHLLHLEQFIEETTHVMNPIEACIQVDLSSEEKLEKITEFKRFANDPRGFSMVQGCGDTKSSVIVIHDSFGKFLKPFLSHSFGTLFYVQGASFNEVKDFIKWVQPDLVIDQRVERNMLNGLVPDSDIETKILKKRFVQSNNYRLNIDKDTPRDLMRLLPNVRMESVVDGLRVQSEEIYPFVGFTLDPGAGDEPLIVRLRLTSDQDTSWLLYYTTAKVSGFIPAQTISMPVKKGYNEFYFRLPYPDTIGPLQFHPGANPGVYTLHSFVIKRETRSTIL